MTVAEVILALAIITVGLLALIAAMPLGTSQVGEANLKTTATFLAQQRLEQIKNSRWTTAPAADTLDGGGSDGGAPLGQWPDEAYTTISIPFVLNGCPGTPQTCASYPNFRRQVRITDCSVAPCSGIAVGTTTVADLRQVTVTVFFRPLAGTGLALTDEEAVQLTTLIAKR